MSTALLHLLLLIMVANGVPVVMRYLLGRRLDYPLDMGKKFIDGKRILGPAKTWRGLFFSILFTTLAAIFLGVDAIIGATIAFYAMLGDLFSSFIKRRFGMRSSSMAPLLDQVPESFIPAYFMMSTFALGSKDIVFLVVAFIILELLLSKILYKLGIRRTPY